MNNQMHLPSRVRRYTRSLATVGLLLTAGLGWTTMAQGGAIRSAFNADTLPANDDGSTALTSLGFTANFFGTSYTGLYVNNNGNVTFDSALSEYTPFSLSTTSRAIIAPFFADVDTRDASSDLVTYGTGTVGTHDAFGVNWVNVGYYNRDTPLNSFQLVLIDRSDVSAGDFDIEFNYDQILWESGDASDGEDGLGGDSARVGYSNGTPATSFELTGSAVNGAFLDSGPSGTSLINNRLDSDVDGRYYFEVRNGVVQAPVPEPTSLAIFGFGAIGFAANCLRRRKKQTA